MVITTIQEAIDRVIEILESNIGPLDKKRVEEWSEDLHYKNERRVNEWPQIKYLVFEDHNIVEEWTVGYDCHFVSETERNTIWRDFFYDCEPDSPETREGYCGIVDLYAGKYLRINGNSDIYEYDLKDQKEYDPDWSEWLEKPVKAGKSLEKTDKGPKERGNKENALVDNSRVSKPGPNSC